MCFVQVPEANADKSEKSIPRFPLKIRSSGGAHNHLLDACVLMSLGVKFPVHSRGLLDSLVYACGKKPIPVMVMLNLTQFVTAALFHVSEPFDP